MIHLKNLFYKARVISCHRGIVLYFDSSLLTCVAVPASFLVYQTVTVIVNTISHS